MHAAMKSFLLRAIPIPARVVLALMGFLGIVNAFTMRICLSVAITEMVIKKVQDENANKEDVCPVEVTSSGNSTITNSDDLFEWSEELQGVILSSFYWGYVITHLPGGLLAEKFGGKYVLSIGIFSTAIFTLFTPLAIDTFGAPILIAFRVLEGLGEGTKFPALNSLLATWIPLKERSKLGALVFGGAQVGTILGNLLSGVIIDAFDDWRAVFYFFGGSSIIWFIFFSILCYSDPESHPFITDREKEYLKRSLGKLERDKNLPPTPWKMMFTNKPLIALIVAQIGHDFGFYIMVTDLPKYMSDVLHFNIKENGLFTALPYMCMWFVSLTSGVVADYTIKNGYQTITRSRKLFTSIASFFPALFIVAASYGKCDKVLVVGMFSLAMAAMGTFYSGMRINALDLSPNYAGTLMAITNGLGAFTGILGPYIVGVFTPNSYITEWRIVFWIAFGVFNITNIVYLMWASGETQSFNDPTAVQPSIESGYDNKGMTKEMEFDQSSQKI